MKIALAVLVGLLLVANVVAGDGDDIYSHHKKCEDTPVFKCVESREHCWEEQVCEEPKTVPCGQGFCTHPEVCKLDTRKVCKNVTKFKKACAEPIYTCEQELTACGDDFCTYDEECVEDAACKVIKVPVHGSGPAHASASAAATSNGGPAHASAKAVSTSTPGPTYKDEVVCHKAFKCAFKDPCEIVFALKCVHKGLTEGKAYKGNTFTWLPSWEVGQQCGNGFCKRGYKCANVATRVCPEGVACGNKVCDPGYKCLEQENCKNVPFVTPVCADVEVGVCLKPHSYAVPASADATAVAMSNGGSAHASAKAVAKSGPSGHTAPGPVCKTILKCRDVPCGNGFCKAGTACHVGVIPCNPHAAGDDGDD